MVVITEEGTAISVLQFLIDCDNFGFPLGGIVIESNFGQIRLDPALICEVIVFPVLTLINVQVTYLGRRSLVSIPNYSHMRMMRS